VSGSKLWSLNRVLFRLIMLAAVALDSRLAETAVEVVEIVFPFAFRIIPNNSKRTAFITSVIFRKPS
jgi:hypothetical protein